MPRGSGPLEERLDELNRKLGRRRRFRFRNLGRLERLLGLMLVELNRAADERDYARIIRDYLVAHGGTIHAVLADWRALADRRGSGSSVRELARRSRIRIERERGARRAPQDQPAHRARLARRATAAGAGAPQEGRLAQKPLQVVEERAGVPDTARLAGLHHLGNKPHAEPGGGGDDEHRPCAGSGSDQDGDESEEHEPRLEDPSQPRQGCASTEVNLTPEDCPVLVRLHLAAKLDLERVAFANMAEPHRPHVQTDPLARNPPGQLARGMLGSTTSCLATAAASRCKASSGETCVVRRTGVGNISTVAMLPDWGWCVRGSMALRSRHTPAVEMSSRCVSCHLPT